MNPLVAFNRILGWVYLGFGALIGIAWLGVRSGTVLQVSAIVLLLGAGHHLAAWGFAGNRPWRWAAQAAPAGLLLAQLLRLSL